MTEQAVYPDIMGDVRSWLRVHPYLVDIQGARVFFSIPEGATYPLTQLSMLDDSKQPGEVPLVDAMIGLTLWGAYGDITNLANGIKAAFDTMPPGTAIGSGTIGLNADVIGSTDGPDPETGTPRKVLTVVLTARRREIGE
jgi:hypothetical protein